MNQDVLGRIRQLVRDVAEQDVEIALDDNLFKLALLDSVLLIDLVARIERGFGIAVADREMAPDNFLTIERITLFVTQKLDAARGDALGAAPPADRTEIGK